jgi:glutathionylspermidine synthase
MIGAGALGYGMREDLSPITKSTSRLLPRAMID